jgi:uncharacterized membrane protein YeaQ/YmgE (transglycosylase-associated protein family)
VLRARWHSLPRARRRAIEVRGAAPAHDELDAVRAHTRYLGGWPGAAEWVLAGLVGAGVGHLFGQTLTEGGYPVSSLAAFVLVWSLVGIPLRVSRARRLARAVDQAAAAPPGDADTDAGSGPDRPLD